mgnify:CR=1 FL=1
MLFRSDPRIGCRELGAVDDLLYQCLSVIQVCLPTRCLFTCQSTCWNSRHAQTKEPRVSELEVGTPRSKCDALANFSAFVRGTSAQVFPAEDAGALVDSLGAEWSHGPVDGGAGSAC